MILSTSPQTAPPQTVVGVTRAWLSARWLVLSALLVSSAPVLASAGNAALTLRVSIAAQPAPATIRVYRADNHRYLSLTEYNPNHGPSVRIPLPAGDYAISVSPHLDYNILSLLTEQTLKLHIGPRQTVSRSLDFPATWLSIRARRADGSPLHHAAVAVVEGWVSQVRGSRYLALPARAVLPPGPFTLLVINPDNRQRQTLQLTATAGETLHPLVNFEPSRTGTFTLQLRLDGRAVPATDLARYTRVDIRSTTSHKTVTPLSGGHGYAAVLPADVYDISVHLNIIGAEPWQFRAVTLGDQQQVTRHIDIPRPGTLQLNGRWQGQPLAIADCARYHNIFDKAHLGALMGGPSPSRGKCLDPVVNTLRMRVSSPGRDDGDIGNASVGSPQWLLPGRYDITAWPDNHPDLAQTLTDVTIRAGQRVIKNLQFQWPTPGR